MPVARSENTPCRFCEARHLGCHADCEEYNRWKTERLNYSKTNKEKRVYSQRQRRYVKHGCKYIGEDK